jgi:hypothetical protein
VAIDGRREGLAKLQRELEAARNELLAALDDVEPALLTAPGLVGDWSGGQLLGHLALWTEHAAAAVEHAAVGRLHEFGREPFDVDAMNAEQADRDVGTQVAALRQREQVAFERLTAALRGIDRGALEERAAYGDTLAEIVHDDGTDHFREHLADVRAWFGADAPEDEDGDEDADA